MFCVCVVKSYTQKYSNKQIESTKEVNIHYLLYRDRHTGLLTSCKPPQEESMKAKAESGMWRGGKRRREREGKILIYTSLKKCDCGDSCVCVCACACECMYVYVCVCVCMCMCVGVG